MARQKGNGIMIEITYLAVAGYEQLVKWGKCRGN
jgi:hypothetical protein